MYKIINESKDSLDVQLIDKVDKEEYSQMLEKIESKLEDNDGVDLLVDMTELDKLTFGALWEDIKFDIKNFRAIRQFAIIGDKDSKEILATISEPFVKDEAKFFEYKDIDIARQWIN